MKEVYLAKNIEEILKKIDVSHLGSNVAIKVHFGERGCDTYIDPKLVRKVYEKVEKAGKKAILVECNVLYKGSRTNATDHIQTARDHGFTDMNIDILDGEKGDEFIEVGGCKLGRGLKKYDSLIVLSHFKGHMAAGFGGALKNVGMGLGSRAGKLHMHSQVMPNINEKKCVGCGICAEHCNAEAISISNRIAKIDQDKCEGCAMCIAVCPHGAAMVPWGGGTHEYLQNMIAQYAKAVLSLFKEPIFINILENITEECDCMGIHQEPIMEDIGIICSSDIVAADKASLDLVNECSGGLFNKINTVDKDKQICFAEKLGIGKSKHSLLRL
jgi:uncharacterized protein